MLGVAPLLGVFSGAIIGAKMRNEVIEQGICMLGGSLSTAFGIACVAAETRDTGLANTLLISSFSVITLGLARHFYITKNEERIAAESQNANAKYDKKIELEDFETKETSVDAATLTKAEK